MKIINTKIPKGSSPIKSGFTLIEVLVVVAIIGVLASLVVANVLGVRQRGRDAQRKSDLRQIQAALELYRADQGAYPASLPATCNSAFTGGGNTYLSKTPCDPLSTTSTSYRYTYTPGAAPINTYTLKACLENTSDPQKDNPTVACTIGAVNGVTFSVSNP